MNPEVAAAQTSIMHSFIGGVALIAVAVLVVAVVARLALRGGGGRFAVEAKPLLTPHERVFYPKLVAAARALGPYGVHAQVAMGAIVRTKRGLDQGDAQSMRNRFDRKIIDFVIVDASTNVVAIVELDDRSHTAEKDAYRDRITSDAGYRTIRFRNGNRITTEEIRRGLEGVVPTVGHQHSSR